MNGLTQVPQREAWATYDEGAVMEAALTASVQYFFSNTGPTGQRAKAAMAKLAAAAHHALDGEGPAQYGGGVLRAAELARRRAAWKQPTPRYTKGLLAKYAKLVSTASLGAVTG